MRRFTITNKWTVLRRRPDKSRSLGLAMFTPRSEPQTGPMPLVFDTKETAEYAERTLDHLRGGLVCRIELEIVVDAK